MTNEQKDAIRWARDVAIAGKWEHVKALQELLAAGASEGQAEPFGWISKQDVDTGCIGLVGKKIHDDDVPLYTHPSAELTALRERIAGMEKDATKGGNDGA